MLGEVYCGREWRDSNQKWGIHNNNFFNLSNKLLDKPEKITILAMLNILLSKSILFSQKRTPREFIFGMVCA